MCLSQFPAAGRSRLAMSRELNLPRGPNCANSGLVSCCYPTLAYIELRERVGDTVDQHVDAMAARVVPPGGHVRERNGRC